MARLEAKYIPIGEITATVSPQITKPIELKQSNVDIKHNYRPIGSEVQTNDIDNIQNEAEILHDLFIVNIDDFKQEIDNLEHEIDEDIACGKIKILRTNAEKNLASLETAFDLAAEQVIEHINYQIHEDKQFNYQNQLQSVLTKYQNLEMKIDYDDYQTELRIQEIESSHQRKNRNSKRKLEGTSEIGSEDNQEINDYSKLDTVARREFSQNYEGSDLDNIDKERQQIEDEIQRKQLKGNKGSKDSQKLEAERERLRKKQEKRRAKLAKKQGANPEIDTVGNQIDIEALQTNQMDRLMEIKEISAKRKELQVAKEKQRSKATKEFYKYKKVNKQSHIVGFKQ